MRHYFFCAIGVLLTMPPLLAAHGNDQSEGCIYDARDPGDNRSVVINFITRSANIQNKENARIDALPGEFSGSYKDCGNKKFFCLSGALEIVIPKGMPMKQWQYHGWNCRATGATEEGVTHIQCWSKVYRAKPTFEYSPTRGIISFNNSPMGSARSGFVLRGQCGMFAAGNGH